MTDLNPLTVRFEEAKAELRRFGMTLTIALGEYCVNYEGGTEATAYYTTDLDDALTTGRAMSQAAHKAKPPLGPTGRRMSRKAMMFKHNRKIAAKRRREEAREMILLELHQPGELPVIRRVASGFLVRLAVVEAFRQGQPVPSTVDEATALLRDHSPTLWTFYTPDEADKWAEDYDGEQAEAVRHAVRYFVADTYAPPPEDLEPVLYEAG